MKHNIYDNQAKLKNTGVSVTEHLTSANLDLLNKTRDVIGFVNVWTSQTKILANLDGTVYHIQDISALDNVINND